MLQSNKLFIMKILQKMSGAKVLDKNEQAQIQGGVTRAEYCATLGGMLNEAFSTNQASGYQGDLHMGMHFFATNCGNHGYSL